MHGIIGATPMCPTLLESPGSGDQDQESYKIQGFIQGIRVECAQCDYSATRQTDLKRHTEAVHDGIRKIITSLTVTKLYLCFRYL